MIHTLTQLWIRESVFNLMKGSFQIQKQSRLTLFTVEKIALDRGVPQAYKEHRGSRRKQITLRKSTLAHVFPVHLENLIGSTNY